MVDQNGNARWQTWAAVILTFATLIAGLWTGASYITAAQQTAEAAANRAQSLQDQINRMDVRLSKLENIIATMQANVVSLEQLHGTVVKIGDIQTEHGVALAGLEADLREVETQFCASDIVRNLMHVNDMRIISVIWRKAFAEAPLPTDNSYYPMICNRENSHANHR